MLAHCPHRQDLAADFSQGNAYHLPFADRSFDVVLSTWMFSHLRQPGAVVKETMRVLRSDGWCIIVCFSQAPGWRGGIERVFEPLFMMDCVPLDEIRSWPGVIEVQEFLAGCNSIVCLRKEPDGIFTRN
jgi:ubiquinone/menaquinone biosynthesis C-methylase UbiE